MSKVKNRKMIGLLALRELKTSRRLNLLLVLSVILTCVMFTSIANIGGNILLAFQSQNMRMVGTNRMAGLKMVLPADYEKVLSDDKVKDVVYRICVGDAINEEFRDFRVELNCAGDERAARSNFAIPTTGKLPETMDEIAVSTLVLKELQLPAELGTILPLTLYINGKVIEHEFTLCGFWEGDPVAAAQLGWVSREFAEIYAPTPEVPFEKRSESMAYGGYWQVEFDFGNSFGIEDKVDALLDRIYGESGERPDTGVNWAYTMNPQMMDMETILGILLLVLLVFVSGYLIIYNIFQINITANIQKYGLLKTIGMTPTQIQRLVRIQADLYAAIGIPAGLLIGLLVGKMLYHYISAGLNLVGNRFEGVSPRAMLVICLIAAFFSFGTVRLSTGKPARIAGKVSPIEALTFSDTKIPVRKGKKRSRRVSAFSIASTSMIRNRKKSIIVILSLTLSMVLFQLLATALHSLDMDKMLRNLLIGDFDISGYQGYGGSVSSKISPEVIARISGLDGVEQCRAVYCDHAEVLMSDKGMEKAWKLYEKYGHAEKWEKIVESGEFDYSRGLDQYLTLRNLVQGAAFAEAGCIEADLYGVHPGALKYFDLDSGKIDEEKFASGKYAIVYTGVIYLDSDETLDDFYEVGDMLTIRVGDKVKEYEVMAVGEIPYVMSSKVYHTITGHVVLPESEFRLLSEETNALDLSVLAKDGKYNEVREELEKITANATDGLVLQTKQDYLEQFRSVRQIFMVVGGALTGILAIIAVMNFTNAIVTGILSRRKEFVVMQAVGMTGRQMKEMLVWEGAIYAFWTFLCSVAVGPILSIRILKALEKESTFFTCHFTPMPFYVCIPILLALAILVPLISFKWVSRGNAVNVSSLE